MSSTLSKARLKELQSDVLQSQALSLTENIGDPVRYFPALISSGVLPLHDRQIIQSKVTSTEKILKLVDFLCEGREGRDGITGFEALVDALKKGGVHSSAAKGLEDALKKAIEEAVKKEARKKALKEEAALEEEAERKARQEEAEKKARKEEAEKKARQETGRKAQTGKKPVQETEKEAPKEEIKKKEQAIDDLPYLLMAMINIAGKWKGIGLHFRLPHPDLEDFRRKYRGDSNRCLTRVLVEWLTNCSDARSSPPTWRKVVIAVATGNGVGGDNPAEAVKIGQFSVDYKCRRYPPVPVPFLKDSDKVDNTVLNLDDHLTPVLEYILDVGPQWSLIGIFLGIPYSTIKRIDFEGDLDDKVEKMVSAWLKKKHDIAVFGEPTWRILVEAVAAKSGGNDRSLAERIASEHPLLPASPPPPVSPPPVSPLQQVAHPGAHQPAPPLDQPFLPPQAQQSGQQQPAPPFVQSFSPPQAQQSGAQHPGLPFDQPLSPPQAQQSGAQQPAQPFSPSQAQQSGAQHPAPPFDQPFLPSQAQQSGQQQTAPPFDQPFLPPQAQQSGQQQPALIHVAPGPPVGQPLLVYNGVQQPDPPPLILPPHEQQFQLSVQETGAGEDVDSDSIRTKSYSAKERGTHIPQLKLEKTESITVPTRRDHKQIPELEYYPMTATKHGVCLVINNMKFVVENERRGSKRDEHNLIQSWRYLGYRVEVRRNCSLNQINDIFDDIDGFLERLNDSAKEEERVENDSFVCCVLSHGEKHAIVSSDSQRIRMEDLERKIGKSRTLKSKPKLFFVQACRSPPGTTATLLPAEMESDGPTDRSDIYFMYATSLGDSAMRNTAQGSWFVTELCKLLCEFATCCSLHDIQLKLNRAVRDNYMHELVSIACRQQPRGGGSLDYYVHFFHTIIEHEH